MDYEKKYKEMLDDARYWHNVSEGDIPAVLEEIFPELRESEDEKIKKEITELVMQPTWKTEKEFHRRKKLEQTPIEWKQENREELTEFENAMMHIGGSFFGENAGLDPNDTDTIKEQAELLLELAPKTEWSEEDERTIKEIDEIIYECPYCESKEEISNWLKSLKDRYTWKPSKEQMIALRQAISGCSYDIEPLLELETKLKEF